jgi:hypothetical protein
MALTTYSDLQTSVASYLARSDLTSQIPDFIQLAEVRLRREIRIRQMLKLSYTTAVGGDSTVGLPSDFLEMRNIYLGTNPEQPLDYYSPGSFVRNTGTTVSGKPLNYTILSSSIQLAPVPDDDYQLYMLYFASPDFLSSSNPTNTFIQQCPDLLLYGSLLEAEPYLMNDARIATWTALYQRGLVALETADDRSEFSGQIVMKVAAQ